MARSPDACAYRKLCISWRPGILENRAIRLHRNGEYYGLKQRQYPAAETAGRKKLNICLQCHSRLSGVLPSSSGSQERFSPQAHLGESA
jgi:hypothetical protein